MRVRLVLFALVAGFMSASVGVSAGDKGGDEVQRKSGVRAPVPSYPLPFVVGGANATTAPAISTGYYFVDNDDEAPDYWRPDESLFTDTLMEPGTWRRILSGPNQQPLSYWRDPARNIYGGHAYFRNPGNMLDSTDDAFAGPISIGFPFFFNGVRYDSFYVSTNGVIALSNRRYFYEYDASGFPIRRAALERSQGVFSVYDPASDDPANVGGRTRVANGTDTTDPAQDNWGYFYVACGGDPASATRGIRTKVNRLLDENSLINTQYANPSSWLSGTCPALIAPFWDDLQLSVYNTSESVVDDFGKAYFKRSPSNDKLIIYFVRLTPHGPKRAVVGGVTHNVTFALNNRPGQGEHYSLGGQVILNRQDSSVVFMYERFQGIAPRNALQPHPAPVWVRCNSTIGVTGAARRLATVAQTPVDLDFTKTKYTQSTEVLCNVLNPTFGGEAVGFRQVSNRQDDGTLPRDFLAIKFKQWKNYLRVINVFYRVRPLNNNAPLDFTQIVTAANANNYELLAGETRLGAIQPIAIIQNLTNNIQGPVGVNYVRQGVNFRARFRIINEATGKIIYNTSKSITDAALRDSTLSGVQRCTFDGTNEPYAAANTFVRPYEFVKVTFPPFEPNEYVEANIGRMIASVIAEPRDSVNQPLGDEWPFDDTTGLRLFVMRRLTQFNDDVNEYHLIGGSPMPSILKWVNLETEVVDGDELTNNPPPPRGEYAAHNNAIFTLKSPVIRMNRVTLGNQDIPAFGTFGGDELRSFPINLLGRKNAVLSISYQRTGRMPSIARGWADNRLVGPEHRVNGQAVLSTTPFIRRPDELWVEFPRPSSDGLNGIANIQSWVFDMAGLGNNYTQPFRMFGGGGFVRGFDQANKNQQLNATALPPLGGFREDLFDDGKDFEYQKITIPIPDTILRWVNEGARNFRFRLRVQALNHAAPPFPSDDEDNFFIDNVKILFPDEVTDLEMTNITLIWPYTMAPASQATRVPIRVKISNNTNLAAPAFSVRIQIKPAGNEMQQVYCRTITVPTLPGNREVLLPFPDANFRTTTPGQYKVTGKIFFPGGDLDSLNDSTFTNFTMTFGEAFAYEVNPRQSVNDVPNIQFSGVTGKGLNHRGANFGGTPNGNVIWGPNPPQANLQPQQQFMWGVPTSAAPWQYGADAGNASGQLAMRFTLYSQDTILGYQAFWAELNQDILNISFSLYRDLGGTPDAERIPLSTATRRRGEDELDNDPEPKFGRYASYLLDRPVILPPGEYWASVAQMGTEGYELGASASRMGTVTTVYSDIPVPGAGNRTLLIDKNFRARTRAGALQNDNRFAFELTRFSGDWSPFTPSIGNLAYSHLSAMGMSLGFPTFSGGSWIPLVRPYLGNRSFSNPPQFVNCVIPVELSFFDGKERAAGVDLFWETASEKNNSGFHVERRSISETTNLATGAPALNCEDLTSSKNAPWASIGFVTGAGNTSTTQNYKFFDSEVAKSTLYEYRLRQVDFDGTESFSNVVNVAFGMDNNVALESNFPNPSTGKTTFRFRVPSREVVRFEVFDMMGNLVKTLYNDLVTGQNSDYVIEWDGRDENNLDVASGAYLYRLTAGENSVSRTMTVVR